MKIFQKCLSKNMLVLLSAVSLAACSATASADNAKNMINTMLKGRAKIVKEFDSIAGLKGFVLAPSVASGQQTIVYADKEGRYLFSGNLVSPQGKNISQQDYQTYVTSVTAPAAYNDAKKTNWFLVGKKSAPHKAYMIVEPNCSACHMAYEKIKPMIDSGKLAVRFIVVAFLKPDSEAKAAAILAAKNPSVAFASDEKGFVMSTESGGIKPLKTVDAATKAKIKSNIDFMQQHHFSATPVIIYKTSKGKYETQVGFPGDEQAGQAIIDSMANKF